MSSILKALKKIDEDSSIPQAFPSLPQTIDAKKAVSSQARKRWFFHRLVTVCLILLVVGVAAVILFSQRRLFITKILPSGFEEQKKETNAATGKMPKVIRSKIPPQSKKQATRPPRQTRPPGKQIKTTTTASTAKKSRDSVRSDDPIAGVGQPKTKVNPSAQVTQPRVAENLKKPLKKRSQLPSLSASNKSIAGRRAAADKPLAIAKQSSTVKYDRVDGSKLKLQALAWYHEAARRMAVINNRVVREGESVDGYQITQIRQEDVVVNDGRKSWSLEFGLK